MPTRIAQSTPVLDDFASRRAIALANVRWFRGMARRALRDGLPKADLRAANARAAARIVLAQAKRDARRARAVAAAMASDALMSDAAASGTATADA